MKQSIRLTERELKRLIRESVNEIMMSDDEYPSLGKYYVAADTESDYFDDYDKAYNYALHCAEEARKADPENWEEVHLLDNENWQSIVIFNANGIHDLECGRFTPWADTLDESIRRAIRKVLN